MSPWLAAWFLLLEEAAAETPAPSLIPVLSRLLQTAWSVWEAGLFDQYPRKRQARIHHACLEVSRLSKQAQPPLALLSSVRYLLFDGLLNVPVSAGAKGDSSALRQGCRQYALLLRLARDSQEPFACLWAQYSPAIQKEEERAFLASVADMEEAFAGLLLSCRTGLALRNLALKKAQTLRMEQQLYALEHPKAHQRKMDTIAALQAINNEKEIFLRDLTDNTMPGAVV